MSNTKTLTSPRPSASATASACSPSSSLSVPPPTTIDDESPGEMCVLREEKQPPPNDRVERGGEGSIEEQDHGGVAIRGSALSSHLSRQESTNRETATSRLGSDSVQRIVKATRVKARVGPQPRREETCNYCLEVFYPTEKFFEKHAWCCYKCHRAQKRMCRFMGADYDSDEA